MLWLRIKIIKRLALIMGVPIKISDRIFVEYGNSL